MSKASDLKSIVDLIKNDPNFLERLDGPMDEILPDNWGAAGTLRNIGYIFQGLDPSEPEVAARVCTGISNASSKLIREQIEAKNPIFSNIKTASTVDRERDYPIIGKVHHTATTVTTNDGETYVLDYHHTLNSENPMLYPSIEDWKNETNGQTAEEYFENNPLIPEERSIPTENNGSEQGVNSELDFSNLLSNIRNNIAKLNGNMS